MNKNVLLHQMIDLNDEKFQILRFLHEKNVHKKKKKHIVESLIAIDEKDYIKMLNNM